MYIYIYIHTYTCILGQYMLTLKNSDELSFEVTLCCRPLSTFHCSVK